MVLWHTFLYSLQLPKKQAMFKLNRIGMDFAVIYVLLLTLIGSIPVAVQLLSSGTNEQEINTLFWLVYFFFIYYVPLTIGIFLVLTFIAYMGTIVAKLMHRKLKLSILWKMSAFASTIPALIYTIIAFVYPLSIHTLWLFMLYVCIFLVKMITVYPKRRQRRNAS
ncbi:DUF1189 family protein [Lentibacillus saliphilus]|uniref:DUF1189 family protein n=1 Tax=Lentibacillus saliphilus TaxID=2737028 RepID=UPI001C3025C9|nr:DUF1189 family protein [Lentibacillus saliphilus]